MGYYINKDSKGVDLPLKGKGWALAASGATLAPAPNSFSEIPSGRGMVCVVDNGAFEAVAYAYSESEFEYLKRPDGRDKLWMEMDKELAERLSGYKVADVSVPSESAPAKPIRRESAYSKPKKKKHRFVAEYRKGYAIINGVGLLKGEIAKKSKKQ